MTIWRVRVACWISKDKRAKAHARTCAPTPTQTHARWFLPTRKRTQKLLFHRKICFVNAPRCYVLRVLPLFLFVLQSLPVYYCGATFLVMSNCILLWRHTVSNLHLCITVVFCCLSQVARLQLQQTMLISITRFGFFSKAVIICFI